MKNLKGTVPACDLILEEDPAASRHTAAAQQVVLAVALLAAVVRPACDAVLRACCNVVYT